jgi:hypothetical protein
MPRRPVHRFVLLLLTLIAGALIVRSRQDRTGEGQGRQDGDAHRLWLRDVSRKDVFRDVRQEALCQIRVVADGKIKCEVPKLKAGAYTVKVHTTADVSGGKRFKVL